MKLDKVEQLALKHMGADKNQPYREKGYIYNHGKRVGMLALKLAAAMKAGKKIETDIVYVGGLFHDIGKGKSHHALAGAKMLPDILKGAVNKKELTEIQRLVAEHNLRDKPNKCQLDSKIIQDADTLDHIGAQNVWLSIHYCAKNGASPEEMIEYFKSEEEAKLVKKRREGLNFEVSKKEFNRRIRFQNKFIAEFADEL